MQLLVLILLVVCPLSWAQRNRDREEAAFPDYKFTSLDLDLFRKLLEMDGEHSITFSPLSIRSLLAMVKEGVRGPAQQNLEKALGATSSIEQLLKYPPRGGITMGNAFYLSNNLDINDEFRETLTSRYNAEFQYADFSRPRSAAYNINEWVRRTTNKGITEIISVDALSRDTVFMMVNAIHLAAKWKNSFDTEETSDGVFYESHNGALVPKIAPIMHQYNRFRIGTVESLNARVIELPFKEPDRYSMYIVLPKNPNGLREMIANMKPESLKEILQSLGPNPVQLTLSLPRFQASTAESLRRILPKNVATIFESNADISGISPNENVRLSEILHKATLEVDEQGATGSAATAVHAVLLSNTPPITFNASHPFFYFMAKQVDPRNIQYERHQTMEIFFMGHVSQLESQDVPSEWSQLSPASENSRNQGGGGFRGQQGGNRNQGK